MQQQQATLRPGDIAVALELVLRPGERYENLSQALRLSLSAAHRAVRRLEAAELLLPRDRHPNKSALLEFLTHGVRYSFPAMLGAETRGVPTAGGLPEFRGEMPSGSGAVWPSVDGTVRGPSIVPLYEGAAAAALANARLHRLLALVDALRIGPARERSIAERLLRVDLGIT
jgi:hypothetical protein